MFLGPKDHKEHLLKLKKLIAEGDWTPPDHLSDPSKQVWAAVVPERVRSVEKRFALTVALEARDELAIIHSELMKADLVDETRRSGARHVHPLVPHAGRLRKDFQKAWATLRLNHSPLLDGPDFALIESPEKASDMTGVHY